VAIVIEQPARSVFVLDMLLIAVAMWTFGGRMGLVLGTLAVAGAWLCALVPASALLVYNGAIIGIAALLAVAWSRASRQR